MKITICSSAFFVNESYQVKKKLEEMGHTVLVYPQEVELNGKTLPVEEYYRMRKQGLTPEILKLKSQLIDRHIEKIESSDAILVLNFDKNGKQGYIGGNTFLEMSIAYYLGKNIFVWQGFSEDLPYYEEIAGLNPIVIGKSLERIR